MSMVYYWLLGPLQVELSAGSLSKVVTEVAWQLVGAVDEHIETLYGQVSLPPPDSDTFTPFDALTPHQVEQWVIDALGADQVERYKTQLASMLEARHHPATASLPPPWA